MIRPINQQFEQLWMDHDPSTPLFSSSETSLTRQEAWQLILSARQNSEAPFDLIEVSAAQNWQDVCALFASFIQGRPVLLLHHYLLESQKKQLQIQAQERSWPLGTAVLIPTSGTTGAPKLIPLTLDNLVWNARGVLEFFKIKTGSVWNWQLPLSHVGGLGPWIRALVGGLTISTGPLAKGDLVSLVPVQLQRLLSNRDELKNVPGLILIGGSAVSPALWQECAKRSLPLSLSYGMTEAASTIAASRPEQCHPDAPMPALEVLSYRTVTIDREQRIHLSGPCMSQQNVITNDRGQWSHDEHLTILGRMDRTIISGGMNISLDTIEKALARLGTVMAIGVPDQQWGERPIAFLWPSKTVLMSRHLIDSTLEQSLPRPYWPAAIYLLDDQSHLTKPSKEQLLLCMNKSNIIYERP